MGGFLEVKIRINKSSQYPTLIVDLATAIDKSAALTNPEIGVLII